MLVLAGRPIPDALDHVRRYVGLSWSGGGPEVWAYRYYDAVPTGPGHAPSEIDVLAAGALHPGLTRENLEYFITRRDSLVDIPAHLPDGVDLGEEHDRASVVAMIPRLTDSRANLALVSKVLHRKRPRLIPLFDRALVDWYRPVTGVRGESAWEPLLGALRADLGQEQNREALAGIADDLARAGIAGPIPSRLRLADIAIWMAGRDPRPATDTAVVKGGIRPEESFFDDWGIDEDSW